MFSYDVHIDFTNIAVSMILISLIGATVDTAIAISTALFEVYDNNKNLSKKELFLSGMTNTMISLGGLVITLIGLPVYTYMNKKNANSQITEKAA